VAPEQPGQPAETATASAHRSHDGPAENERLLRQIRANQARIEKLLASQKAGQ
jgi:hypothetical protein